MKKIFALTLALLLCFAIVACSDDGIERGSDDAEEMTALDLSNTVEESNTADSVTEATGDDTTETSDITETTETSGAATESDSVGTSSEDKDWTQNY